MSVNIKSDGTPFGTKVTTSEGVEISGILGIDIAEINTNAGHLTAKIEVMVGVLDLENINGKAKAVVLNDEKII